jgi:pimeloyl-ACP methyl ester carboxylesterase
MDHPNPTHAIDLQVKSATPAWFDWALAQACASRHVDVQACRIHYLSWQAMTEPRPERGILFVHGGGAHANWWRFIAPFFAQQFRVAALDLSGMGDSARREEYSATLRAEEIRAVLGAADLGERPFIVGHSFGGYMTLRFGVEYGEQIGGAVIADTPVRRPGDPPPGRSDRVFNYARTYATLEEAIARFRLLPAQPCENEFLVEFIARHSVKRTDKGWTWKFDPHAMGAKRWEEPFHEHMQNMRCRTALIHGQRSALVNSERAAYMSSLMGPKSPVVEIPEAQHHLMLDQPLAFVATVRTLLETWMRAEA